MVGFDPTVYTVTEGVNEVVVLTLVRSGNTNLSANVSFMTLTGTADGMCMQHKLSRYYCRDCSFYNRV